MMKNIFYNGMLVFCVGCMLFSCNLPMFDNEDSAGNASSATAETAESQTDTSEDTSSTSNVSGGTDEIDALFTTSGSSTVFSVNDEQYWSSQGYTLWTLLDDETTLRSEDYTVKLSKSSGTAEAGYGILFGHVTSTYYGNCMQIVLLNTNGQFTVGELLGTTYKSHVSWTTKDYINIGYDAENTVRVSYNVQRGCYYIYINDNLAYTLWAPGYANSSYGKKGYIAVISPKDRLPDETVTVTYTQE